MHASRLPAPPRPGIEALVLCLLGWGALVAVPWSQGGIGLNWDALNHHIYLGWIAESPRWDRDFLAAAYQSFQFPYLYWPVWKLYEGGASGRVAGAVLATLSATAVPALWLVAARCIPGRSWWATTMRTLGVASALLGPLTLSMLDGTSNDLLAAVPMVWALALALQLKDGQPGTRLAIASGLCAGLAVAFKLSNGPLSLVLPLAWALPQGSWPMRLRRVLVAGAAVLLAFGLSYGPWGWALWTHFGNPVYPFADNLFAPLRAWAGRP